jgi:hypothetical protein
MESVHKQQNIKGNLRLFCGQAHMPTRELESIKGNTSSNNATKISQWEY